MDMKTKVDNILKEALETEPDFRCAHDYLKKETRRVLRERGMDPLEYISGGVYMVGIK